MARPRHQNGWLTEHGNQIYGNFWRYVVDQGTGERKKKQACVPLGKIGELKKWKAREQLKRIIAEELGPRQTQERPDPQTTFEWFVENRYLPMREGRWHQATKDTTYEIKRYLVEYFGDRALEEVTQFEVQVHLNKLAKDFSDSIVRHAFSNMKTIFRTARKMKFISEDPAEDLRMPDTRIVKKPKIEPKMILDLIDSIPHPRDRALLAVGCFCGPRTSENLGLTWKSYAGDHFVVYDTAYEGVLYEGKVKTEDSRARIPIPERVWPYIDAWRRLCPDKTVQAHLPSAKRYRAICPTHHLRTTTAVSELSQAATGMVAEMATQSARQPVRAPRKRRCAPHSWRALMPLLPPNSMRPRMVCPSALAAKTCAPWPSACSSNTPATEVCDERSGSY
jgi:integrase